MFWKPRRAVRLIEETCHDCTAFCKVSMVRSKRLKDAALRPRLGAVRCDLARTIVKPCPTWTISRALRGLRWWRGPAADSRRKSSRHASEAGKNCRSPEPLGSDFGLVSAGPLVLPASRVWRTHSIGSLVTPGNVPARPDGLAKLDGQGCPCLGREAAGPAMGPRCWRAIRSRSAPRLGRGPGHC